LKLKLHYMTVHIFTMFLVLIALIGLFVAAFFGLADILMECIFVMVEAMPLIVLYVVYVTIG
jgi:hypothetical protein